jgi:urease accessory protein
VSGTVARAEATGAASAGAAPIGEAESPGRNRVVASASVAAVAGADGTTRLPVLASQVPLVLRRTPDAVYLVGGAAGPLGGDSLSLTVTVGAGACLRVRTTAASVALPGLDGLESVLRVTVAVGAGGRLEYLPEPVVVADAARHATVVSVTLAPGASLVLRDEVLLGRHGEAGGSVRTDLRVSYAGRPLLRHSLAVSGTDPASLGPAVLSGRRGYGTLLLVNESGAGLDGLGAAPAPGEPARRARPEVAVMPLAGPGVLVTALADDAVSLRRRLTLP